MAQPLNWDERYREAVIGDEPPARVLREFTHLLPAHGQALEIACGLGANACLLARHGLDTQAWDNSAEAIAKLASYAREHGLSLQASQRDVIIQPPAPASFDVIVVTRFLERSLLSAIAAALRPGGLLYYQTYLRERPDSQGPSNPAFLLEPNELLHAFTELHILVYREEGLVGDLSCGWRNEAMLVACQPQA